MNRIFAGSVFEKKKGKGLDPVTKFILAFFILMTFLTLDSHYRSLQKANREAVQKPVPQTDAPISGK